MKKLGAVLATLLVLGLGSAQTLVFGGSGLPVSLDDATDGNSLTVAYQILENLVFVEPGGTELEPGLATEWSSNEDGTVWTFALREGVTFHDGTPFNAEAAKFNIDRWNDPAFEYGFRDEGKTYEAWRYVFGGFAGEETAVLQEARVTGEYTLELTLNNPMGFLPAAFSSSYFGINSPTAIQEVGADYGTPAGGAVGTGPFQFVEWVDGTSVTLERYADYWGEPAGVEQLVFRGIEDPTARLAELQAGSIDMAVSLSPDDLETIEGDDSLEVVTATENLNIGYIGLHQANTPLENQQVRQAVAHAVDWNEVVAAFFGEGATVATQFIPPGLVGFRDDLEPYAYDPAQAEQLLGEAGYPRGDDGVRFTLTLQVPSGRAYTDSALAVGQYLTDVGVQTEVELQDFSAVFVPNLIAHEAGPLFVIGSGGATWSPLYDMADIREPDGATNYTEYANPEWFSGWERLAETRDAAAQQEIVNEMLATFYNDPPWLMMYFQPNFYGVSERIAWEPRRDGRIAVLNARLE